MRPLRPLLVSDREVLPLVEGGKGISISNGESSGAWAAAGGVGTFSGVNADSYDANGNLLGFAGDTYTWNSRNELAAIAGVDSASFQYDALVRRLSSFGVMEPGGFRHKGATVFSAYRRHSEVRAGISD